MYLSWRNRFQNIYFLKSKEMKACSMLSPQLANLHKTISLPAFQREKCSDHNLSPATSSSSCESVGQGYWRSTTKWILRFRKKTNISKSTIYLSISYLYRLIKFGFSLNEENYEKVGIALILLSAKMNEIYPPKMSSLVNKCSRHYTKDELSQTEGLILQYFGFNMCFTDITYSFLAQLLEKDAPTKLEDSERLLSLAVSENEIMRSGQKTVALSIIYLIKPTLIREMGTENLIRIKSVANKVYNLYLENKSAQK